MAAILLALTGTLASVAYEYNNYEEEQVKRNRESMEEHGAYSPKVCYINIRDYFGSPYYRNLTSLKDAKTIETKGIFRIPRQDIVVPGHTAHVPIHTALETHYFK